jgi:hypothetical protein
MVMQMFLVQDIIRGGDWQVVLQKEPHAKWVVVEAEKLLLRVDINGEEGG